MPWARVTVDPVDRLGRRPPNFFTTTCGARDDCFRWSRSRAIAPGPPRNPHGGRRYVPRHESLDVMGSVAANPSRLPRRSYCRLEFDLEVINGTSGPAPVIQLTNWAVAPGGCRRASPMSAAGWLALSDAEQVHARAVQPEFSSALAYCIYHAPFRERSWLGQQPAALAVTLPDRDAGGQCHYVRRRSPPSRRHLRRDPGLGGADPADYCKGTPARTAIAARGRVADADMRNALTLVNEKVSWRIRPIPGIATRSKIPSSMASVAGQHDRKTVLGRPKRPNGLRRLRLSRISILMPSAILCVVREHTSGLTSAGICIGGEAARFRGWRGAFNHLASLDRAFRRRPAL